MKMQFHNPNPPRRVTAAPNYFHSLQQIGSTRVMPPLGMDASYANSGISATPMTGVQTGGFAFTSVPYGRR